jgi:hypothetical protein
LEPVPAQNPRIGNKTKQSAIEAGNAAPRAVARPGHHLRTPMHSSAAGCALLQEGVKDFSTLKPESARDLINVQ